jgi:hypothetical protein
MAAKTSKTQETDKWAESVAYAQKLAKLVWENHKDSECAELFAAVGGLSDAEFLGASDRFGWRNTWLEKIARQRAGFSKNPEKYADSVQKLARAAWKTYNSKDAALLASLFGVFSRYELSELEYRFEWGDEVCEDQQRLWFIEAD